jgi:multicomponent Na+:H+ antiporter subunit E
MNGFVINILLALAWVAITGNFSLGNLAAGFGLGLLVLFFTRRIAGAPSYTLKLWRVITLALFFMRELIQANLRLAYDVLTPNFHMQPGVIAIPLDAQTDTEITLLSAMINLTPGSLTIDVSADRSVMYIHAMYLGDDPDAYRRSVKDGFERRILEVTR